MSELLAKVRQSIETFSIAIQEIDTSRKTLDSMFAATNQKITKKADKEIAKVAARIREEKQKLMQEAEQIRKTESRQWKLHELQTAKRSTKHSSSRLM